MRGPLKDGAPEMNSVHRAEVASIKPFGVFVRMEGYRTNGLVHVSQVGLFCCNVKRRIAT